MRRSSHLASSCRGRRPIWLAGGFLLACTLTREDLVPEAMTSAPPAAEVAAEVACTGGDAACDSGALVCGQSCSIDAGDAGVCGDGSSRAASPGCTSIVPACTTGECLAGLRFTASCDGGNCPNDTSARSVEDAGAVAAESCDGGCGDASCDGGTCAEADAGCTVCPTGHACALDADCVSGRCRAGVCAPLRCEDGLQNGNETDVDCGGDDPQCATCRDGLACGDDSDCSSGDCDAEVCVSCQDGVQNGNETAVDCGGGSEGCDGCADGQACGQDADCDSLQCLDGLCISCSDGLRNGGESAVDCGGVDTLCGRCGAGRSCDVDSDCASGACEDGSCCGGSLGDCTRCAERLAPTVDCADAESPPGVLNCGAFLECLRDNQPTCSTSGTAECSQNTDSPCYHNGFGGNTDTGVTRAVEILLAAGCQLFP